MIVTASTYGNNLKTDVVEMSIDGGRSLSKIHKKEEQKNSLNELSEKKLSANPQQREKHATARSYT